ncbi:hypothetical protein AVEN_181027-1 [Araneus ventricosus]|uniref:Uncharacterized protein n=1 Tax=Araneus ventricosus TaxID=182803 RepID=A0A4Y2U7R9_ARAVE|nr:hypothetical protein AVEN_181027-1 [Araneus ventricosus]
MGKETFRTKCEYIFYLNISELKKAILLAIESKIVSPKENRNNNSGIDCVLRKKGGVLQVAPQLPGTLAKNKERENALYRGESFHSISRMGEQQ